MLSQPSLAPAVAAAMAAWPAFALPSAPLSSRDSCGDPAPFAAGALTNKTAPRTGRPYSIWLPADYPGESEPYPVILSLHGATRTPQSQAALDRLTEDDVAGSDHIIVYPSSTQQADGGRYWQGAPTLPDDVDDVGYIIDILDHITAESDDDGLGLCVDESRIYATGKSQGGGMVDNLACDPEASARLAAIAPVAGAYYVIPDDEEGSCDVDTVSLGSCEPARTNFPVLAFHGGNDTTVPIEGEQRHDKGCLPNVRHWLKGWVEREGMEYDEEEGSDVMTAELTSEAKAWSYGKGMGDEDDAEWDDGTVIFVYAGDEVGHDWPYTDWNADNEAHGTGPASFDASPLIVDFFRKHRLEY